MINNSIILALGMLASCFLCCCNDSDKQSRDARFTTSTKAKPNPQKESLEALVRAEKIQPMDTEGLPSFPLYSDYQGENMRQLTGVSGRSLIICFSAPWCIHSQKMLQSLKELAQREQGKVQIVNIDADSYPAIAKQFKLKKTPTSILYVEGVQLREIIGAYTAKSLQEYLRKTLSIHNNTHKSS